MAEKEQVLKVKKWNNWGQVAIITKKLLLTDGSTRTGYVVATNIPGRHGESALRSRFKDATEFFKRECIRAAPLSPRDKR